MTMRENRARRRLRDAAAHRVLDELDGASRRLTAEDEDRRETAEVTALRHVAEVLGELPFEAWSGIPDPAAATRRVRARSLSLRPGVVLAAVLISLLLGFEAGSLTAGGSRPASADRGPSVALRPLAGTPRADLATAYMPAAGQMVLRVEHLPPSPAGTYYELWLMTDVRRLAPVTAFRVAAGGSAQLTLRLPDDPRRYVYLDISRQRLGGGTQHSAASLLRGRIA